MASQKEQVNHDIKVHKHQHHTASASTLYGLGFIGAIVYYFQQSVTITDFLMAILKSLVWPALLVHKVFGVLGM